MLYICKSNSVCKCLISIILFLRSKVHHLRMSLTACVQSSVRANRGVCTLRPCCTKWISVWQQSKIACSYHPMKILVRNKSSSKKQKQREQIENTVFQYVGKHTKRASRVYVWGYAGTGALGK